LPDLFLAGLSATNNQRTTYLFHNQGDGTFTDVHPNLPGFDCGDIFFGQCSAEWGDFDNDSDLDLLILGATTNGLPLTKILRNDGNNVFTQIAAGLPALRSGGARWGDYDNDGFLDIALTGTDATTTNLVTRIYHNNQNGTFSDIGAPLTNVLYGSLLWLDFDNDGYSDLAASGHVGQYGRFQAIYRNNRNGTFSLLTTNFLGVENGAVTCADIDNDGDLDVFIAGSICTVGCGGVQLYRNNGPTNTPPSAPTNIVATLLPDNNVRLSWARASDAQTPQAGLSYDLRVGTSPGGAQVMYPAADVTTGKRRSPQPGGMHTNTWLLKDVPKGSFYWAVQSIDTAFAGSAFSTEGTFTITNARPTISPIADQITPMNQPTPPIPFLAGDLETQPPT
jgi:hypothetical protein